MIKQLIISASLFFLVPLFIFGRDPVPTKYWRSGFENGFPGEWHSYNGGAWTETGIPNPGRTEAWTIVSGNECPGGAKEGTKVYKGWLLKDSSASHRAYPGIHCDYASPLVNSWWVYLDTDYANFPSGGWHHFGTWGNNTTWDVHTMSVLGNGKLEMAHVDSLKILSDVTMPLRKWVRFTVYIEYAPAGKNLIFAWMDDRAIMSAKNRKPGGSNLQRAHWGLYTSGNLFEGIQYNDDIQIWGLSEPWIDFSRVPPSPYDSAIGIKENNFSIKKSKIIIRKQRVGENIQFELINTGFQSPIGLFVHDLRGKLIARCKPSMLSDKRCFFKWDGKDHLSNSLSNGVCVISVTNSKKIYTRKLILFE